MATPRQVQRDTRAKLGRKNQVVLPQGVCDDAGIEVGAELNISVVKRAKKVPKGTIVLAPADSTTRSWTDAEWDRKIREAEEDVKHGDTYGPFDTAADAIKFLRKQVKTKRNGQ